MVVPATETATDQATLSTQLEGDELVALPAVPFDVSSAVAADQLDAAVRAYAEANANAATVLEDGSFDRVAAGEILELVDREGSLAEVEAMAEKAAERARRELQIFPDVPSRNALEYAPSFILRRRS